MTQITEDATVESGLPPIWEALRMVSGLVAVLAIGALVLATTRFVATGAPASPGFAQPATTVPAHPDRQQGSIAFLAAPPRQALFVFYLVRTPEQAEVADWGEQVGAMESVPAGMGWRDRSYSILYARDEAEEALAGRQIAQQMIRHGNVALVHVVDLRDLRTPPTDESDTQRPVPAGVEP